MNRLMESQMEKMASGRSVVVIPALVSLLVFSLVLALAVSGSGCATAKGRFLLGAGIGSAGGAGAAAALSPNSESRGLNALVFGLVGAVAGGTLGLLLSNSEDVPKSSKKLPFQSDAAYSEMHLAPMDQPLPEFVKKRFQPTIIEEAVEPDAVSEDGTLHEPHKVYRIVRPAELYSRGAAAESTAGGAK